jgi:hypothetical protein
VVSVCVGRLRQQVAPKYWYLAHPRRLILIFYSLLWEPTNLLCWTFISSLKYVWQSAVFHQAAKLCIWKCFTLLEAKIMYYFFWRRIGISERFDSIKIWVFHSSVAEHSSFVVCCAMSAGSYWCSEGLYCSHFQCQVVQEVFVVGLGNTDNEALCFLKMSVTIYWSKWHNIPEDLDLQVESLFISLSTPG